MSWFDVNSSFAEMAALSRQVDALIGQGGTGRRGGHVGDSGFVEEGEALVWRADLPGTPREHVDVTLENGVLTVHAHRPEPTSEGRTARHRERGGFELHRQWRLPDTIDTDSLDASLEHGVLTLRMRQIPAVAPRRIAVS